jgi:hypothetical protein
MGIDDIVRKAKEVATDERIDQAAEQLRKVAPDHLDRHVDTAAEHAKRYNADDAAAEPRPGAAASERVVPPNSADPGPETREHRQGRPPSARP